MIQRMIGAAALAAAAALVSLAAHAQTVKVAYIDPLSGPFANVGEQGSGGVAASPSSASTRASGSAR